MSGQHRHAEPEAGDVACLDPRAVTEDGEFVRVGGCRDRRALSHAASPARQPCGAAFAGTQAHSAGESIVTSDSSVTASAATSGAGTTVVGIVPGLPVVFRSNSARQFMFSAGGAGVEATNRAPTGPLLYSGRPETRSAGPAPQATWPPSSGCWATTDRPPGITSRRSPCTGGPATAPARPTRSPTSARSNFPAIRPLAYEAYESARVAADLLGRSVVPPGHPCWARTGCSGCVGHRGRPGATPGGGWAGAEIS